LSQNLFNM